MSIDRNLSSYDYTLPEDLTALRPLPTRSSAKLLVYREEDGLVIHTTMNPSS